MNRFILHSDLNNFFASVECVLNPDLKDKYVAVCGNKAERHGIVLAKNQAAKSCGVKTGEAIWQAKLKCPSLTIVPPQFDMYLKYSNAVKNIYYNFTDMIEPFGIDECWLDVSGCTKSFGGAVDIAYKIKEAVKSATGLTVSVGVSFNKVFAKLGSDMKKPDAVTAIPKESFKEKVWCLDVECMLGVGRKTLQKLKSKNINTIGDIAASSPERLKLWLGKSGISLWNYANGYDNSPVSLFNYEHPLKSIGRGTTCVTDLNDIAEVKAVILKLSEMVSYKLRENCLEATGISVTVKDKNLVCKEFQIKLNDRTADIRDIYHTAADLFEMRYDWKNPVRSVTVRAINLISANTPRQLSFFDDAEKKEKLDKLGCTMVDMRKKFGGNIVTYATLLGDMKTPKMLDIKHL